MFGTTCWTVDVTLEKNEVKMNNGLQRGCFWSSSTTACFCLQTKQAELVAQKWSINLPQGLLHFLRNACRWIILGNCQTYEQYLTLER